jgi:outer membrane lipoprotein-sorting protein
MNAALFSLIAAGCFGSVGAVLATAPDASTQIIVAEATPAATPPAAKPQPSRPQPAKPVASKAPVKTLGPAPVAAEEPNRRVFAELNDKAVVDRVLASIEGITTLQSDFTQIAPSGAESTGKFYLRRPGLLRFEYDEPSPVLIVATGGTVFVEDKALETTDSYPVGKTPLKYLLKKRVELGEAKIVSVDRGEDSVAVTFASNVEDEGELSLILAAPALELQQWIVRDPQNGVTFVTLSNVKRGGEIPNRLFAAPETGSAFLKD